MAKTKIENGPAEKYSKPHGKAYDTPFNQPVNQTNELKISADNDTEFLLMDIPMYL